MTHRDINNIDKTILDNFYKLVHSQPHVRLRAASSTFKILDAFRKKTPTKFNDNLNYCVDRLVAGLASSRALARQGYGTLLLELLNSYQVSTDRLFTVANDKFGQVSRETSRDNLIGYFLLISIVLKSENHKKSKANSKFVEKIYKLLMQLLSKKTYMECPISRLLMDHYELFCDYMIEDTPRELVLGSDSKPSPGEILMWIITKDENSMKNLSRVSKFSQSLNQETNNNFAKYLANMLKRTLIEDKTAPATVQVSAIRQITNIVRRPQMVQEHEFIAGVAKTFFENYLCSSKKFHITVSNAFKSAYHNVLDHLISVCGVSQRVQYLMSLIDCYNSHQLTQTASKSHWSDYMEQLKKHKQVITNHNEAKQLYPITSLYLFYGLQIIEHGLECKTQLEELAHSSEEALKGDPNDGSWADVLTDQILAILSATECSPWIRKLCGSVFGSLLPHISQTSIDLICDALKSGDEEDEEEEEDDDADLDDEDDVDEEGSDVEAMEEDVLVEQCTKQKTEKSKDVGSGDDDDADDDDDTDDDSMDESDMDDEDDSMDDCEPDPIGRDDEDLDLDEGEEEYLDDEQMMKLDSVLADMFKLKSKKLKNKGEPAFKLRCLDLVDKIIQKKPNDTETIETLLATILPMALRSKKSSPVNEKVTRMLAKMKGKSKYPKIVEFLVKRK